jgi:hypothetical protein
LTVQANQRAESGRSLICQDVLDVDKLTVWDGIIGLDDHAPLEVANE